MRRTTKISRKKSYFIKEINSIYIEFSVYYIIFWFQSWKLKQILYFPNFQVDNVNSVHLIGAALAFLVGGAYFHVQTYISWTLQGVAESTKKLHILRLVICVAYDIFAVIGNLHYLHICLRIAIRIYLLWKILYMDNI